MVCGDLEDIYKGLVALLKLAHDIETEWRVREDLVEEVRLHCFHTQIMDGELI